MAEFRLGQHARGWLTVCGVSEVGCATLESAIRLDLLLARPTSRAPSVPTVMRRQARALERAARRMSR